MGGEGYKDLNSVKANCSKSCHSNVIICLKKSTKTTDYSSKPRRTSRVPTSTTLDKGQWHCISQNQSMIRLNKSAWHHSSFKTPELRGNQLCYSDANLPRIFRGAGLFERWGRSAGFHPFSLQLVYILLLPAVSLTWELCLSTRLLEASDQERGSSKSPDSFLPYK